MTDPSMLTADVAVRLGTFDLDVAIEAAAGETVALLGPNGAGKSTLLRCLAGLTPIDRGRIVLGGVTLEDTSDGTRTTPQERAVGMVFQQHLLFPSMTTLENVAFGLRSRGVAKPEARSRATALLDLVGLGGRGTQRPHELSGGQSQRVALARALAIDPQMILLDEPLAALDVTTRSEIRRELRAQLERRPDCVRLLVTHDPVDAFALADRVVVVQDGRVTQDGALADVASRPRTPYLADLMGVNLLAGESDGSRLRLASGVAWRLPAGVAAPLGAALVAVRRRDVALVDPALPPADDSNEVQGTVRSVDLERDRAIVTVDGAVGLVAEVDPVTLLSLGLRPGDAVRASVQLGAGVAYPG